MNSPTLQDAFDRRCAATLRAALEAGAEPAQVVVLTAKDGWKKGFPAWMAAVIVRWAEGVPHLAPPTGWYDGEDIGQLFYWTSHGDWPTYRALLAHTPSHVRPLVLSCALWETVGVDAYETVERLLDAGAPPNGYPGHKPILSGTRSVDVARLLVARGADPNGKPTTPARFLPIVMAAGHSVDLVRYLFSAGARLDGRIGRKAVKWASRSIQKPLGGPFCRARILRLLQAYGADIEGILQTALRLSVNYSFPAKVDRDIADLLALGADPRDLRYIHLDHMMLRVHPDGYPLTRAWLAAHDPAFLAVQ